MATITAHCCQNAHALLGLFQGSVDAQRLARESHELLHELEPVLNNFIQLVPAPNATSLLDAVPTLQLFFLKVPYLPQTPTELLQAFMKLMHHSTKLNAWPDVKTAFWMTIANTMLFQRRKHVMKQLIPLPTFPQFVVCYGRPRAGAWSSIDGALGDAICDVMTESPKSPLVDIPRLELSLGYDHPTVDRTQDQMELIENMVDRLLGSPNLQCKITSLDFSATIMPAPLLTIGARIVEKCRSGYYQVEQVKFDGVIPGYQLPGYEPSEVPREFFGLLSGAFGGQALPRVLSSQPALVKSPQDLVQQSVLRSVSLSGNYLTPNFFPVHFSALRYGCMLEEDLTEYSIRSNEAHPDININCWRWLAFGLFYPRPKRFADTFKLRTIGKLTLTPPAIRMIINTVRNPVAQLVNNDLDGDDTSVADCLMVCTVKGGAKIEVFVSGVKQELVVKGTNSYLFETKPIELSIHTAVGTSEFEALSERKDGCVCIVVPGAGLGWVRKSDVILLEREPLELAWSTHDGRYNALICADSTPVAAERLRQLFESIGCQFESLTFDFDFEKRGSRFSLARDFSLTEDESVVQAIVDHCSHLKHLNIVDASPREIATLLEALDSSTLGAKLLTLNLNDNKSITDAVVERLASILTKTGEPLALEELRVAYCSASPAVMGRFHDVFTANRTLARVELYCAKDHQPRDVVEHGQRVEEEARVEAAFQDQVLRNYCPLDTKLAFLSVVNDNFATTSSHGPDPQLALDQELLSQIFGFTVSLQTRRAVVWNEVCD